MFFKLRYYLKLGPSCNSTIMEINRTAEISKRFAATRPAPNYSQPDEETCKLISDSNHAGWDGGYGASAPAPSVLRYLYSQHRHRAEPTSSLGAVRSRRAHCLGYSADATNNTGTAAAAAATVHATRWPAIANACDGCCRRQNQQ